MKFIHTGDLHIGKVIHEFSLIEDQKYALNSLINIIKEEKPNALVIAGDLYDRSVPPAEAVEVLSDFFTKVLKETKTKILCIAGNHDSSERLSFLQDILEGEGLFIQGYYSKDVKKVTLNDNNEYYNFYLLPYVTSQEVKKEYEDITIKTQEDALRKIIENINITSKSILIAHTFAGVESKESDSERPLNIGAVDIVDASVFKNFTYTALGHLHRPQNVSSETIRYSGSLLKYSISESNQKKSITIVNIENNKVNVKERELDILRDLKVVRGYLNDILDFESYQNENLDDYVFFEILDEGDLIDPIGSLRSVYKNVLGLRKVSKEKEDITIDISRNYRKKDIDELFLEFYNEFYEIEDENKVNILPIIKDSAKEVNL